MATARAVAAWGAGNSGRYKQNEDMRKGRPAKTLAGRPIKKMKYIKLILLIALALCLTEAFAVAEEPVGYDQNTEIRLTGTVLAISRDVRGPVIIRMKTASRIYDIYTGPLWFWDGAETGISENIKIQVTGSKMIGRDGSLRLVCRQIKNLETGRVFSFRDEDLKPIWKSRGRR
jgi:hypothetical protein